MFLIKRFTGAIYLTYWVYISNVSHLYIQYVGYRYPANVNGIGFLWNKPVVYVFIRPERYTFEFIEKSEYFTLSFLGEENRAIHKICGSKSGREVDKVKETGLKSVITEKGNILFEQGRLSLECRKLYTDIMKEESFIDPSVCKQWYGGAHGGLHHIYVAEITGAWMRE